MIEMDMRCSSAASVLLMYSFCAAHVQLLREVRIFRTRACGRPERKHSQIFDNLQHLSAYKLLFANILCVIHHFKFNFFFRSFFDCSKEKNTLVFPS